MQEPSYFVHAERNNTVVTIPIYNVPELDKPVKASARKIVSNLRGFGWWNVYIRDERGLRIA